jgi:hypothetical protein
MNFDKSKKNSILSTFKKQTKEDIYLVIRYLFEGTFLLVFKVKKSQRMHKTVEIKVYLTF